ncbi:MAG: hypothetical protein Q9204_002074 [Flavoplaca sp. TL-2023a]
MHFREGRWASKDSKNPWMGADLLTFVDLNNKVFDRFSAEERANIGIHTCPGGDCDSVYSGEVPYAALLPSLFAMNAGYFLIQLASEKHKTSVYKQIGESIRRDANGVKQVAFIGVTNPLNPKVETAVEVAADILEASKYIAKGQLGATDDCGFSPFSIDVEPKHGSPEFARDIAMQKIKARVDGARMTSDKLGVCFADRHQRVQPETETWATYLAKRIQHDNIIKQSTSTNGPLRILDLCTGSGCISLLLFALLSVQSIPLQILGVDISQAAVKLAQRNLIHNISKGFLPASALSHIDFPHGDVFAKDRSWKECEYDIVVSNPPYISPINYNRTTTRSVRNHEPRTALVPTFTGGSDEVVGDAFYPRLISIARDTKAKVLVMEVGDMHQAMRIVQLVGKSKIWQKMEIWADGILDHHSSRIVTNHLGAYIITIRGKGEARAVAVWGRSGEGP